jgi:disulfide bond formation protein DsbB
VPSSSAITDIGHRLNLRFIALGVAGLALGIILLALAYEHIGGYVPCELCYRQRWAYYAAIPLALLGAVFAGPQPLRAVLAACGLIFLVNAGLGVHHAGVEWGWWPGPEGCSGGVQLSSDAARLLESLRNAEIVRCDEPAFRFLGLSFAGYNALISAGLAAVAGAGALMLRR